MFKQSRFRLITPEGYDFGINKSSLMHGAILELVSQDYGAIIHSSSFHPYSQYISQDGDSHIWTINTMNDEAEKNISDMVSDLQEIYIRHDGVKIGVEKISTRCISVDDLYLKYHLDIPHKTQLRFITPTAFKSDGGYVNMPSVRLMFQSLMRKYDELSGNIIYSDGILSDIIERVSISSYKLRSTRFSLEGVTIPAFIGDLTLYTKGGGALPGLVRMLCEFAEYSGIGIKTSIGMGAVEAKTR